MPRQRLQHELQLQTGQVRRVLAEHRMDGRTLHGELHQEADGRRTSFGVRGVLHAGLAQVKALSEDLQRVFREAAVQVRSDDEGLNIELTAEQYPVPLLDVLEVLPPVPPLTAVLGWTAADQPVLLNLNSPTAHHVLLAGQSGAGKTGLLRSIALSLAMHSRERDLQLVVIDGRLHPIPPSSTSLTSLNYLPHLLTPVIEEREQAKQTLLFLGEMVQERQAERRKLPAIVILVDHVVALLEQGGREMLHLLTYLVRHGGATGIHLVLATRRPTAPHLADLYETGLPARVVGRVGDAAVAEIAADALQSGAERLLGEGDFVAIVGNQRTHFQGAAVSEYDLHYALEELYAQRPPVVIAQPFNPRPHLVVAEPPAQYHSQPLWDGLSEEVAEVAPSRITFKRQATAVTWVDDPDWHEEMGNHAAEQEEDEEEAGTPEVWQPATYVAWGTAEPVAGHFSPQGWGGQETAEEGGALFDEADDDGTQDETEDETEDEEAWGFWEPPTAVAPRPVSPPPPAIMPAMRAAELSVGQTPNRVDENDEEEEEIPFTWESVRFQTPPPARNLGFEAGSAQSKGGQGGNERKGVNSRPFVGQETAQKPSPPSVDEAPIPKPRRKERPQFNQVRSLLKEVNQSLEENPPSPISPPPPPPFEPPTAEVLLEQFDDGWHTLPPAEPPAEGDEPTATTIRVTSKQAAVLRYPASLQRQRPRRYQ